MRHTAPICLERGKGGQENGGDEGITRAPTRLFWGRGGGVLCVCTRPVFTAESEMVGLQYNWTTTEHRPVGSCC